jgi:hypothetical protein
MTMTRILRAARASVCAVGLTLLTGAPLAAHHSFEAEYDANKVVTLTGIVTKLDWVNPHAYVSIDSKDEAGMVHNYKIEMGPPYALVRGGWKRDTLKIGDKVTIEGAALAKNGTDAAGSMPSTAMVLAGGQRLVMR